jgi:nucleoid DNA-binding protein
MTDTPGSKPSNFNTAQIAKAAAERLYLPEETVEMVLLAILEEITAAILRKEKVSLKGLGTIKLKYHKGYPVVRLKTSTLLKEAMKEAGLVMDKYGVDLNNEAELMAKVTGNAQRVKPLWNLHLLQNVQTAERSRLNIRVPW